MSGTRAPGALRPLEAFDALARFARRRGDASLRLAMHAAVPQSFRPELLHLLRLNFVPEAVDDTAAEADVLLAPFTDDLGGGYFQFDPEIRRLLLDYLGDTYAAEPVLRARRVADFLLRYVGRAERHVFAAHDRLGREFLETQRWVGLAFARPEEAAEQLAGALQAAEETPELGARLHLGGLAQAVAIPLAHHRDLLNYARGLQLLATGETDAGQALLEPLLDREITVGRVTLQPGRVVGEAPPADEIPAPPEDAAVPEAQGAFRVFISGTLLDLKEYREAAAAVCEQLGLVPVRWETLPASAESPHSPAFWDSQRIDLLLCLVGQRYGSRGERWSGTETELNHARSRKIDVLPFFVDAGDAPSNGEEWERLQAFRTRIVNKSAVQSIQSLGEFRVNLSRQLAIWIQRRQERPAGLRPEDEADRTESGTPGLIRSLFLSYEPSEWHFARQLQRDLTNAGFEIRMDFIHVPGTVLLAELQRAIGISDGFLCVVTQNTRERHSLDSEWQSALDLGKPVIPILRAESGIRDLPEELQSFQSIDFREERPYQEALNELLHALRPAPAPRLAELYRVPPMPSALVDREILVEVITSVFEIGSQATILEGPAGIGKTTLAIQLAHDAGVRRRFSDGVLWFPDQGSFRDQQAAFLNTHADALNEAEAGWLATSAGITMGMRRVLADGAYLVILDDVQDGSAVESLAGAGPRTHVLATARDAHVWRGLSAEVISVLPFTGQEALRFLALRLGVTLDELPPETREIAEFTEFHPLTLELIARQLRAGTSWSAAVETLRDASNTWSRDERVPIIRRLDMLPPWERRLLASLTLFDAGEEIQESEVSFLARAAAAARPGEAEQALARLVEQSLVERVEGRSPPAVRLHPLVHRFASPDLPVAEQVNLLRHLGEQAAREDEDALAERYFAQLARVALSRDEADVALYALANISAPIDRIVALQETDIQDLPDEWYESAAGIALLGEIAVAAREDGDLAGAREVQERLLQSSERLLGLEHPDTLSAMARLAITKSYQGDLAGAQELQERVVEVRLRVLGHEHEATLDAMHDLARTYIDLGNHGSARRLQQNVVQARLRVLGPEHPDTLAAMIILANVLRLEMDLSGAQELQEKVLSVRRAILGERHPDTLGTMANLALTKRDMGDLVGAVELQRQVLAGQQERHSPYHLNTVTATYELAVTHFQAGRLAEARELQTEALTGMQVTLGPEHPWTTTAAWQLMRTLVAMGQQDAADQLFRDSLQWLMDRDPDSLPKEQREIQADLRARMEERTDNSIELA